MEIKFVHALYDVLKSNAAHRVRRSCPPNDYAIFSGVSNNVNTTRYLCVLIKNAHRKNTAIHSKGFSKHTDKYVRIVPTQMRTRSLVHPIAWPHYDKSHGCKVPTLVCVVNCVHVSFRVLWRRATQKVLRISCKPQRL